MGLILKRNSCFDVNGRFATSWLVTGTLCTLHWCESSIEVQKIWYAYLSSKFRERRPSLLDDLRHFPKHNDRHRVDVPRKPPTSRDSYWTLKCCIYLKFTYFYERFISFSNMLIVSSTDISRYLYFRVFKAGKTSIKRLRRVCRRWRQPGGRWRLRPWWAWSPCGQNNIFLSCFRDIKILCFRVYYKFYHQLS